MPTRERTPIGAPCWVDLMTSDVDGARAFYTRVFGWTAEDPNPEFGGYFSFLKDGVPVAGGMTNMAGEGVPDMWQVYLCHRRCRGDDGPRHRARRPIRSWRRCRSATSARWP